MVPSHAELVDFVARGGAVQVAPSAHNPKVGGSTRRAEDQSRCNRLQDGPVIRTSFVRVRGVGTISLRLLKTRRSRRSTGTVLDIGEWVPPSEVPLHPTPCRLHHGSIWQSVLSGIR